MNRENSGGDDLTTTVFREFITGRTREVDLLPTPTDALGKGGQTHRSGARAGEPLLGGIVDLLPTPLASDARGASGRDGREGGPDLAASVQLLPTPSVANVNDGEDPT